MPTIIGTQGLGYDVGDRPRGEYAFEYSGALYAFLRQSVLEGDRRIYVFRSSDDGATWTNLGANSYVTENEARYTVTHDGDVAYMLVLESSGGTDATNFPTVLKLFTFDLVGHTWSTATDFASAPGDFVDFEYNGSAIGASHLTTAFMRVLVRGPGDCVFFYSGEPSTSGGNQYSKLYVRPFDGSGFGTAQPLPDQDAALAYHGQGGCVDSDADCHLLYSNSVNGGTVLHVGLSPLDVFGTVWESPSVLGTIKFSYLGGVFGDISEPLAYQDGSGESIGFALWVGKGGGASQWIGFFHAPAALEPSFVYQEIVEQDDSSHTFSGASFMDEGVTSPTFQGFQILNTLFCLVKAVAASGADHLSIAWANTQTTDNDTWAGSRGYAQRLVASADTLAWTFDTPIVCGDYADNVYLPANTVVGISGTGRYAVILLSEESDNFREEALVEVTSFGTGPEVTCGSPPDGVVGVPYAHTLPNTHTGSVFTIEVTGGALPDGLTMDSSGEITGTPTTAGDFDFTTTITTPDGSDSVDCTITINPASLGLGCASPPDGVVGVEYHHTFPTSGGTPPYTFAIISGILPPGLTLDAVTGEVSGTPTLAGEYDFVIQVSDEFGSTMGTCAITITVTDLPASGITCDSPPAGEIGIPYAHTFPVTDIPEGASVIYSITAGALPPGLTLDPDTGEVTGTPLTSGHYSFTVTVTTFDSEEDILTDFAGIAILTTGGDTIIVTHGIEG